MDTEAEFPPEAHLLREEGMTIRVSKFTAGVLASIVSALTLMMIAGVFALWQQVGETHLLLEAHEQVPHHAGAVSRGEIEAHIRQQGVKSDEIIRRLERIEDRLNR